MKNSLLQEISIHAFTEFKLGSAEYPDSNTGCTVILSEPGYPTGIDIRGGAPASRERVEPLREKQIREAKIVGASASVRLKFQTAFCSMDL